MLFIQPKAYLKISTLIISYSLAPLPCTQSRYQPRTCSASPPPCQCPSRTCSAGSCPNASVSSHSSALCRGRPCKEGSMWPGPPPCLLLSPPHPTVHLSPALAHDHPPHPDQGQHHGEGYEGVVISVHSGSLQSTQCYSNLSINSFTALNTSPHTFSPDWSWWSSLKSKDVRSINIYK